MIDKTVNWEDVPIPSGYQLSSKGLYTFDEKKGYRRLCPPVAFVEGTSSLETGEEAYQLQFVKSGGLQMTLPVKADALTNRNFDDLIKVGLEITPGNRAELLQYLVKQRSKLQINLAYESVGWLDSDDFGLAELITSPESQLKSGQLKSERFDLIPAGSREKWFEMWRQIADSLPMQLALVLGLSGSLLGILGEDYPDLQNLVVSLIGNSSSGKTTASTLAVSVAGQSRPSRQGTLLRSLSATANALILMMSDNHGVPVVWDELNRYKGHDLTSIVYDLSEGTSKMRVSKDIQLRKVSAWQTTILITGEFGLLDGSVTAANDGLRTRLIELSNVPFTRSSEEAEMVKNTAMLNYGWLLPEFVRMIMPQQEAIREQFQAYIAVAKKIMPKSRYRDRLSVRFGVLGLTADLANKCWPEEMQLNPARIIKLAIDHSEASWGSDLASRLYDGLIDHLKAHQGELLLDTRSLSTRARVIGNISMTPGNPFDGEDAHMYANIFPLALKAILKDLGASSYNVAMNDFKRGHYLLSESDRKTRRTKVAGEKKTVVSIIIPKTDENDFVQRKSFDASGNPCTPEAALAERVRRKSEAAKWEEDYGDYFPEYSGTPDINVDMKDVTDDGSEYGGNP